jgi:UDP-N-acetylmuramate dehydrogenase
MKTIELKKLLQEFEESIIYNADLKKKIGLTLVVKQKFFLKQTNLKTL